MAKKLTTQDFIDKSNFVHNHKYGYDKAIYGGNQSKVIIMCHIHGEFTQKAAHHLFGHGCSKCGDDKVRQIHAMTVDAFKLKAISVHQGKYGYNDVAFLNLNQKITINCPKHGDFHQTAWIHLYGSGCKRCANEGTAYSIKEFIEKAECVHGTKYNYSESEYYNGLSKLKIFCNSHNEFFFQEAHSHLRGNGCQECGFENSSFRKSGWIKKANGRIGTFYIIRCWNDSENFYKFGITCRELGIRYNNNVNMPYNYEIVRLLKSKDLSYIWDLEKRFAKFVKKNKYTPKISFGGAKRECYIKK